MKLTFNIGDTKQFVHEVTNDDVARFDSGVVHHVYATFSLARDVEWSGRLFVLEMLEDGEEGIGTKLSIEHVSPAFPGNMVVITSTLKSIFKNNIITTFEAKVGDRLIAFGEQGQKIVNKEKLNSSFNELRSTP